MSNPPRMDVDASIAGEPARNQTRKNVPNLHIPQTKQPTVNKKTQPKKKFFLSLLQTILLVCALMLSTYSYVQLDTLSAQKGNAGENAPEMLVRTEGRIADSICTEGGAEIYLGNDLNSNGYLDEDEIRSDSDPLDPKSQPVEGFEIIIPGSEIALGAWDIIGILTGVPLALWISIGLLTRGKRGRQYEAELEEAESLEELNAVAAKYEFSIMWKMIGPHQALRLERMRTEIERDKFMLVTKDYPDVSNESMITEAEGNTDSEIEDKPDSPPDASMAATQTNDGHDWLDYEGSKWYRVTGSDAEWTKLE